MAENTVLDSLCSIETQILLIQGEIATLEGSLFTFSMEMDQRIEEMRRGISLLILKKDEETRKITTEISKKQKKIDALAKNGMVYSEYIAGINLNGGNLGPFFVKEIKDGEKGKVVRMKAVELDLFKKVEKAGNVGIQQTDGSLLIKI